MENLAATQRQSHAAIKNKLIQDFRQFRLFQAVRLIELLAKDETVGPLQKTRVGQNNHPENESIRFGGISQTGFAGAEIETVEEDHAHDQRLRLETSLIGLTGPTGALPRHYTMQVLQRLKQHDHAMKDFFDLFNHRSASHYYRAWIKHRLDFEYEAERRFQSGNSTSTLLLNSLVGQGIPSLQERNQYHDTTVLRFAGLFSSRHRTASGLETILTDSFSSKVFVHQFQSQWLYLEPNDCTRLRSMNTRTNFQNQLGVSAICGERIYDMQSRIRVVIVANSHQQFTELLPGQKQLGILCELTRRYIGMEFDFDVQVELEGEHIPPTRLDQSQIFQPQLGRNCWLRSQPIKGTVRDAVFKIGDSA